MSDVAATATAPATNHASTDDSKADFNTFCKNTNLDIQYVIEKNVIYCQPIIYLIISNIFNNNIYVFGQTDISQKTWTIEFNKKKESERTEKSLPNKNCNFFLKNS